MSSINNQPINPTTEQKVSEQTTNKHKCNIPRSWAVTEKEFNEMLKKQAQMKEQKMNEH